MSCVVSLRKNDKTVGLESIFINLLPDLFNNYRQNNTYIHIKNVNK